MGEVVSIKEQRALTLPWGNEIDSLVIPPTKWIVEDFLPHGLSIISGAPKIGKSILMTQLCVDVAEGHDFLDTFKVEQGRSVFLSFEEPVGDVRDRIHQINSLKTPQLMSVVYAPDDNVDISWIERLLDSYSDTNLLVLDIISDFKPIKKSKSGNIYDEERRFTQIFRRISEERRIAIVGVCHTNQNEKAVDILTRAQGSNGFLGTPKTVFIMLRDNRSKLDATFLRTGRKIATKTITISLDTDNMIWQFKDNDSSLNIGEKIVLFLSSVEGATPKQISDVVGKDSYKQLSRLQKRGAVTNTNGVYSLAKR